jgi:hypothetical protein
MFERFTGRARRVLVLSQEEARLFNHSYIGTEHILLGLIHEGEGIAARALALTAVSLDDARQRVEETRGTVSVVPTGSPPFTPRAKKVLELSLREALQLGHNYIGTEHLLLGLVREGEGVGAQVLVSLGADLSKVRETVIGLISGYTETEEGEGHPPGRVSLKRSRRTVGRGLFGGRATLVACSFCGRRPPETGQLVSGTDAFICEGCVERWALSLGKARGRPRHAQAQIPLEAVRPTGPPPDDEDAARTQVAEAFATYTTFGADGRSLPMVEQGEDLGPCLAAARENSSQFVPEGAALTLSVDEVAFVDAGHATVWFTVSVDGTPMLRRRRGEAFLLDGGWKMARSTFCDLMALVGVECPPLA